MLSLFSMLLFAGLGTAAAPPSLDFDAAFADHSRGTPLHFIAHYVDGHGAHHRLEEWRDGLAHLRRRTDDRIDLHADADGRPAPAAAPEYVWQVIDLKTRIDHRIRSQDMLTAGLFYSYWSMAHVLARPAGRFTVSVLEQRGQAAPAAGPATGLAARLAAGLPACTWYTLAPEGLAASHVCWSSEIAAPLLIFSQRPDGSFQRAFQIDTVDRAPIAPSVFAVDTSHLRIEDTAQFVEKD